MPGSARRSPLVRLAVLLAAAAVALAACGGDTSPPAAQNGSGSAQRNSGSAQNGGSGGNQVLDFRAPTVDGGTFAGASLSGEPVVLWFWAPWCVICRAEAPHVAELAKRYSGEVTFVGVAGRGERPAMRDFVAETGVGSFTHAIDGSGAIWSSFGVTSQPAFAFVQSGGKVEVIVGTLPKSTLAAKVQALAG